MTDGVKGIILANVTEPMLRGKFGAKGDIQGSLKMSKLIDKIAKKFHITWDEVFEEVIRQQEEIKRR